MSTSSATDLSKSETSEKSSDSTEGPVTLRDALAEAFQESQAAEPTDGEPTGDPQPDDDAELTASTDEADEPESSEGQPQDDDESVIQAPEHWSDEAKAVFQELPRKAQDVWLKREREYDQGIQQKAEQLKPIEEAFAPIDDLLKARGADRATAIRAWAAAQQMLDSDPVNGLQTLIRNYGPDVEAKLREALGQTPDDDDESFSDPQITRMKQQLEKQKRETDSVSQQYQQLQQQQAQQQVIDFRDAKDEAGKPLHPYFEQAMPHMQALLNSGQSDSLQDAYEKSIWLLPEYREQFTKEQQEAAAKAEKQRRAKAAEKAKKASTSVNGKASVPPPPPGKATLRDDLIDAYKRSQQGEL